MRHVSAQAVLSMVLLASWAPATVHGAEDGVALAIVYDTSGSMKEQVPDATGHAAPKYQIANRALLAVTRQLESFTTNGNGTSPRKLDAGLYVFHGETAREVIKLAPFDSRAFQNWANRFANPHGNTPLGNALVTAARAVLNSPLSRKHVLIITDGLNTVGPPPHKVLPGLQKQAGSRGATLSVHFVAFDVDARQFGAVKRLGATVVGAADEAQLNSQLQFILQQKILLEDEEPTKTH